MTPGDPALAIGLVVGTLIHPGAGLHLTDAARAAGHKQVGGDGSTTTDVIPGLVPTTLFSSVTSGEVLQALLDALLVGFAIQALGERGAPALAAVDSLQKVVFKVLAMLLWTAPIGAFGAMAALVGATGVKALTSLAQVMLGFYATCLIFVVVVLGALLRLVAGVSIFSLLRYRSRCCSSWSSPPRAPPGSPAPAWPRSRAGCSVLAGDLPFDKSAVSEEHPAVPAPHREPEPAGAPA